MLFGVSLWRQDWSAIPFALEHALKVFSVVLAVVLIADASVALYRLLGGKALDPMRNPLAARTPADFWRRWNRPAQQFLQEYAFVPAGGFRRAVRATLVTFGVSGLFHEYVFGIAAGRIRGYQVLFFSLQGCAVAATMRIRPSGRISSLWIVGTVMFNLATSVLFFQSVDALFPFYWPRSR
jgi:D-alanyl-lipoteichoic acid acyltransferase DltB (MBOAT superfamily)